MSKPTPREFWISEAAIKDGAYGAIYTADESPFSLRTSKKYLHVIEKTPHVSKCIALHDEMLAVLKSTLESLLPYDKEGKMSAIVIAVCDVIKKAEGA